MALEGYLKNQNKNDYLKKKFGTTINSFGTEVPS